MFHVEHIIPSNDQMWALAATLDLDLTPAGLELTRAHCTLLAAWAARTSLMRVRDASELLNRHIGEGWAATRVLPESLGLEVLDVGSGAGFPGFPMRAMRPDLRTTLLEPRSKRAAFLRAVARTAGEPQPIVVESTLEDLSGEATFDVITLRALRVPPQSLLSHLRPSGILVAFPGSEASVTEGWADAGLVLSQQAALPTRPLVVEAWTRA